MVANAHLQVVRLLGTDPAFVREFRADPKSALRRRALVVDAESLVALTQVVEVDIDEGETENPTVNGIRWWRRAVKTDIVAAALTV